MYILFRETFFFFVYSEKHFFYDNMRKTPTYSVIRRIDDYKMVQETPSIVFKCTYTSVERMLPILNTHRGAL